MRKPKYVVAYRGHYFKLGNAISYKRFNRLIDMEKPDSLILALELLQLNDIHYVIVDKIFKEEFNNVEFR